jgi:non-specific serine/threonine protein kinase
MAVARLVRRSLLVAPRPGPDGRSRYPFLETLRAYAQARLDDCGEREETAAAVAAWTVSEAERMAASFHTPDDHVAGRWGDAEQDNLREALRWLLQHHPASGLRLAIALSPWWILRGRFREGRSFLERGLAYRSQLPDELAGVAQTWLGHMALNSADYERALA